MLEVSVSVSVIYVFSRDSGLAVRVVKTPAAEVHVCRI